MIDEDRTMQLYGYTSSELSHGSEKEIIVVCEECGKYRVSTKYAYRDLCHSCACRTKQHRDKIRKSAIGNSYAWKGGGATFVCKNCGVEFTGLLHGRDQIFCSKKCYTAYSVGENHPHYGAKDSDERKQRISAGMQGIPFEEWIGFSVQYQRDWGAATYLNESFIGCHRHHLTKTIVIHIPDKLHYHIRHNLKTGENMSIINTLAIQYLYGWW